MRSDRGGTDWDTRDEIHFIDQMWWSMTGKKGSDPAGVRKELLTGYLQGARLRHDWGDMDRDEVIHYAVKLLAVKPQGRLSGDAKA